MSRLEKSIDHVFTRQRCAVHVCFWMVVLALYVVFFGRKNSNYLQTLFFVGLLMPVTIGTTYFLNYFLVPRFLPGLSIPCDMWTNSKRGFWQGSKVSMD